MNKSNFVARLSVLTIALTLVTTSLIGGTLAKYTTEVTGTGSAQVAKWSFKAYEKNGGEGSFAVTLTDTANTNVTSGKIAPGSKGSFDIVIDASGSETALDYTIKFSNFTDKIDNLKFYSDANRTADKEIDLTNTKALDGNIALADVGTKVTKTVYWEWKDDASNDKSDTEAGVAAKGMKFNITVTGTQKIN